MKNEITRPRALVIGISRFGETGLLPLIFAPDRVKEVAMALEAAGYLVTVLDPDNGPDATDLGASVTAVLNRSGPDDVVVVHVLTHGVISATGGLILVGSNGAQLDSNRPERWLRSVEDNLNGQMPRALLFIDACHSGQDARLSWQLSSAHDPRAWVIAGAAPVIATPQDIAYNGWFSEASARVLAELNDGHLDVSESVEYVPLDLVARRISARVLALAQGYPQRVTATAVDIAANPTWPFFKNPRYKNRGEEKLEDLIPGVTDPDLQLDLRHFVGRARGVELDVDSDRSHGYFVGRDDVLHRLAQWLDGTGDGTRGGALRVVTGKPGSGKSAVLGVVVCGVYGPLRDVAHPRLHEASTFRRARRLAVIHARGRSTQRVIDGIGSQLGLTESPLVLETLLDWGRKQKSPFLVIVDAVDEAENPGELAAALTRIARARRRQRPAGGGRGLVARVLVGTRSGDHWPETGVLIGEASSAGGLVDLEQTLTDQLAYEVREYVEAILSDSPVYGKVEAARVRRRVAQKVAVEVTSNREIREWGEFLVASMFVQHALTQPCPSSDDELELLLAQVPQTLAEVLEIDLGARLGNTPWVREVLTVLALSGAASMPFEVVATLTGAYIGSLKPLGAPEVRRALDAAQFYLRRSLESDGTALYRLYHQALNDHLLSKDAELVPRPERYRMLCQRLIGSIPQTSGGRAWSAAPPYVRRHLLDWVRAGGVEFDLLENVGFLGYVEPREVDAYTLARPSPATKRLRQVYSVATRELRASARFEVSSPQARLQLLAVSASRLGARDVSRTIAASSELTWAPIWATGTVGFGGLDLTPQRSLRVRLVEALGHFVFTVGDDGFARKWRAIDGELVAEAKFNRPSQPPTGLVAEAVGDRTTVYIATKGRLVALDLSDGQPPGEPRRLPFAPRGAITVLRYTTFEGQPALIVGTTAGEVFLLETTGRVLSHGVHGTGLVSAITTAPHLPVSRAFSVGFDSGLSQWRLAGMVRESKVDGLHLRGAAAALTVVAEDELRVFTAGFDGDLNQFTPSGSGGARIKTVSLGRATAIELLDRLVDGQQQVVVVYRGGALEVRDVGALSIVSRIDVPAPVTGSSVLNNGWIAVACQGDVVMMVEEGSTNVQPFGEI